jgi:hypothetical protein
VPGSAGGLIPDWRSRDVLVSSLPEGRDSWDSLPTALHAKSENLGRF